MSHRSCVQTPQGASFRKRNCCWVSGAASVKIAKKPKAEHPFVAFFYRELCGVAMCLVWCASSSLSLSLSLSRSISFSLPLSLSLSCLSLSFSHSFLSLSLFSLLSLSLSLLSPSLPLSLLSRSLHRLNCQPLLTGSKPPNPITNLPTRLSVLSGREPPNEVKHQLVLQ